MNSPHVSADNNVVCLLEHVAHKYPQRPAIVFQEKGTTSQITFGRLWQDASALAGGLAKAGLRPGDRAVIMIPMSIELYTSLIAIFKLGAAAVFVDPWIPAKQIARFADFAQPTGFLGIGKSHLLRWMRRNLRKLPVTVTTGRKFLGIPARYSISELIQSNTNSEIAAVSPDDTALITFTSGSSGEPKGANRTHGFLHAQHLALTREFPYRDDDVDMPMFPVFALNNLVTGISSIVPEMDFRKVAEVDGNTIVKQMNQYGVTTVTASPPLLDRVAGAIEGGASTRPAIRRVLTGGAPVSDDQLERWVTQYGESTEIVVAYGSTEAEPVGHIHAPERLELAGTNKGFCTGGISELVEAQLIPIVKGTVDLEQVSVNDLTLPQGEIGELIVAGDHVCRDYYKNPAATAENKLIDAGGKLWHRMGDTGYFDEAGRFWLVGRVHSTIETDDGWVHPHLLEQSARTVAGAVDQVAAIGFQHATKGMLVGLVMYSADGVAPDHQALVAALVRDGYPCDFVLESEEKLPVDPRHNSKIDYTQTREKFTKQLEAI